VGAIIQAAARHSGRAAEPMDTRAPGCESSSQVMRCSWRSHYDSLKAGLTDNCVLVLHFTEPEGRTTWHMFSSQVRSDIGFPNASNGFSTLSSGIEARYLLLMGPSVKGRVNMPYQSWQNILTRSASTAILKHFSSSHSLYHCAVSAVGARTSYRLGVGTANNKSLCVVTCNYKHLQFTRIS